MTKKRLGSSEVEHCAEATGVGGSIPSRAIPRFLVTEYFGDHHPKYCRPMTHARPCGELIDGNGRVVDDECACGCDAYDFYCKRP